MAVAIVFAAAVDLIWWWIFWRAADHYARLPAFGYSGAWDVWVYLPLGVACAVAAALLFFTLSRRSGTWLSLAATAALFPAVPYLMMTSGGV